MEIANLRPIIMRTGDVSDRAMACHSAGMSMGHLHRLGTRVMLRRKTATYALLALYEIGRQHRDEAGLRGIRAGDIAARHKLPKAYVAKILSQLASAGILRSNRGPRGGFRLNRSPETISLYDVFEGVGALVTFGRTDEIHKDLPPGVRTMMTKALGDAAVQLRTLFMQTRLEDILEGVADARVTADTV